MFLKDLKRRPFSFLPYITTYQTVMDEYNYDDIYGMYYDLNSSCPDGFQLYTTDTLEIWTFYFRGPLSIIIAVFNGSD
jgi:hypothetical protein